MFIGPQVRAARQENAEQLSFHTLQLLPIPSSPVFQDPKYLIAATSLSFAVYLTLVKVFYLDLFSWCYQL